MLRVLRAALNIQVTIGELIGVALVLAVPYLIVGVFWSTSHSEHLQDVHGADLIASFLGSIVFWPVLLFSNVCMT